MAPSMEDAAQRLLQTKMATIRALDTALQAVSVVEAELAEAQRKAATAYADAQRAGWTAEELKQLGAKAPAARPAARTPRQRRTTDPAARRDTEALTVPSGGQGDPVTGAP